MSLEKPHPKEPTRAASVNPFLSDAVSLPRHDLKRTTQEDRRMMERMQRLIRVQDLPLPKESLTYETAKAEAWIASESDPRFQELRRALVEQIHHVTFDEFLASLEQIGKRVFSSVSDQNYRVLLDYKPHASKYWIASLTEHLLDASFKEKTFFTPAWERKKQFPLLEKDESEERDTYVVLDDTIYSGEQIMNRAIMPVVEHAQMQKRTHVPRFVIAAPYVTQAFINKIEAYKKEHAIEIDLVYEHVMPSIKELLSDEQKEMLKERDGALEKDGDVFYQAATLTYFDHTVADDHSFCGEVKQGIGLLPRQKPYSNAESLFYVDEEKMFQAYKDQILSTT